MSNHAAAFTAASNDSEVLKKIPSHSIAGQDEATARVVAAGEEPRLESDDDELAERMGYTSEFSREFKSLSTISFAFSIMYVSSSSPIHRGAEFEPNVLTDLVTCGRCRIQGSHLFRRYYIQLSVRSWRSDRRGMGLVYGRCTQLVAWIGHWRTGLSVSLCWWLVFCCRLGNTAAMGTPNGLDNRLAQLYRSNCGHFGDSLGAIVDAVGVRLRGQWLHSCTGQLRVQYGCLRWAVHCDHVHSWGDLLFPQSVSRQIHCVLRVHQLGRYDRRGNCLFGSHTVRGHVVIARSGGKPTRLDRLGIQSNGAFRRAPICSIRYDGLRC